MFSFACSLKLHWGFLVDVIQSDGSGFPSLADSENSIHVSLGSRTRFTSRVKVFGPVVGSWPPHETVERGVLVGLRLANWHVHLLLSHLR